MNFVQIDNKIINLDQIKYIEKSDKHTTLILFGEETEETRFTAVVRLNQDQSDRFLAYLENNINLYRIP